MISPKESAKLSRMYGWSLILTLSLMGSALLSAQSTGGRILGRVADPSGAVLSGVKVTATNEATGVSRSAQTNDSGDYVLVEVQPGTYTIQYELTGFKKNEQKGVIVDVNQVVTLNSTLQIGGSQEVLEVSSEVPQVDTTSTQLGAVINERSVNELPLNARNTYQFLQLQPGVQAQLGSSGSLFFGSDDPGSVSVNGGRTRANNFSVNGGDANDIFVNLPTIQPTPDSIAEFRVITNTFDAEYGRNSGSVVNVITKSGTNAFHGNVYEYFRNTILDAQGFLNTTRPQLNQNQFGGTFGGAIKKDRTFFFASYEGRRIRSGQQGQLVNVPTSGQRNGDFSQIANPVTGSVAFTGTINDQFVADVLNGRPNCTAAIAAIPGSTMPAAGVAWSSVFPTSMIPSACQDPVAMSLQGFIPGANLPGSQFQNVPVGTNNADQFTLRFDHRINDRQSFTAYYYFNNGTLETPFNTFEDAGASLPGFGNYNDTRDQQYNLAHTWTISNSLVNEARFVYMREGQIGFLKNMTTGPVTSSCPGASKFCFTGLSDSAAITSNFGTSASLGITPGLAPNYTGVPFVSISGFVSFGNNWEGQLPQVGNSFQWSDGLTWVKGTHTMKFGVDIRRGQFDQFYYYNVNGDYNFYGTGNDVIAGGDADYYPQYLLGLADNYSQGSAQSEAIRTFSIYPFVQDSWKIRPNVTLNYGLRWEFNTPPTDVSGHVETFRPGQNSTVYPCQLSAASVTYFQGYGVNNPTCANTGTTPTGLVVPGDRDVPKGMTSNYYKAFAPRIGISYSPNARSGILGTLFGDNGKTSIKTGWGMFYNPIEQLVLAQFGAEPPFGGSSYLNNVFFNTPFVYQDGSGVAPNPYGGVLTPKPGTPVDLSVFRPMLFYGEFQPNLRAQYTIQYNLTIQRQLTNSLMLQVGYVGSEGHRLLVGRDINPSTPQTCLDMYNISQYYAPTGPSPNPGLQTAYGCGPTLEDSQWILPPNTIPPGYTVHLPYGPMSQVGPGNPQVTLVGLRPYSSPNCNPITAVGCPVDGIPIFTSIFAEDTVANSAYNAFEAMLEKRFSRGLQFQAAYTWSKSLDEASTFEETLNPFNPKASRALSLFNSAQRFVISYDWQLPIAKRSGFTGVVVNNWEISGITSFQSGFPIRLDTEDDYELINSLFFLGTEAPSMTGTLQKLNPKQPGQLYLNYNQFSDPPLGQFNNGTQRSVCCGPGMVDWDFSVHKVIPMSETRYFQFRGEIFNLFNRTNFSNPDGHYQDGPGLFGKITQVSDPREVQFALKYFF
ncbi:MAG: carboxypeptidase regulatory-like domain-containing protein [Terriglobales bacterium]